MSDIGDGPDVTEGDAPATSTLNPALPDEFDLDHDWADEEGVVSFGGVLLEDADTGDDIQIDPEDPAALEQFAALKAEWATRLGVSLKPDDEGFVNAFVTSGLLDPKDVLSVIWSEPYHLIEDSEQGIAYLVSEVHESLLEDCPGCGAELHRLGFVLDGLPDSDGIQTVYFVTAMTPDDMPIPESPVGETIGAEFTPEDQIGLE